MTAQQIFKPGQSSRSSAIRPILLAEFLGNLSLAWKIAWIVLVFFVGILSVAFSAYYGLQSLRYQLSNIYDFMLVPIVEINRASAALADAQYNLSRATNENNAIVELQQLVSQNESDYHVAQEIMTRYDMEWVTTTSQKFTQSLREGGKLDLQEKEVKALANYHTAFDAYLVASEKYFSTVKDGNPDIRLANEAIAALQSARAYLQELIDINNQFADFSNSLAQDAYRQVLLSSGIVLAVTIIISLAVSYLITLSVTGRLGDLTHAAESMQKGNLDQTVAVGGRDEIALLGTTFNAMSAQIKNLVTSLEQRVADRIKALSASLEVSRRLSAAVSTRQLAVDVVEQLQAAFGYYHAHIYFFDESGENLVMAGGTGEAGAKMLAAGHSIPRGRGLVGRAAETKDPVLVEDVSQSIGWLPNPLLPETQSELAVPIMQGEQILGVIDIQQNRVGGLDENDVALLEAIAAQVAISYQNARSIERARQQAEFEALVNYIGQRIQRADTVEETLQTAMQELAQVLGAPKAIVSLKAPSDQEA